MPSVITHPAVALGLAPYFRTSGVGPRVWAVGALCTAVPDLDTIGSRFGIPYGHPLGHRGLTHSVAFALVLAGVVAVVWQHLASMPAFPRPLFAYLFLCCVSHGVLDAFTNGGLGVAFFAPFSNERFFFPCRPITVAPLSIARFFNGRALPVLASELQWVVVPSALLGFVGILACPRAGLTTRCSGLATLAAELDIVRPRREWLDTGGSASRAVKGRRG